jgi:hypothetical protein
MRKPIKVIFLAFVFIFFTTSLVAKPAGGGCCNGMNGPSYCDSSAGRLVCKNGFYSTCYCTRHAVMDLQLLSGCCLWKGGVVPDFSVNGLVLCRDGSLSEECSLQNPPQSIAAW